MEQIEEGGNTKEKMTPDMDSSSKHVEELQAEKHDKDPNVQQNLMDPNLKRIIPNHSAKISRKKKVKFVKELEDRAKMLEDQIIQLRSQEESYQKQIHHYKEEEKALIQEIQDLEKKALLKDVEVEKNMNKIKTMRELQNKKQEQLLKFIMDPIDQVLNNTPSFQDGGSGSKSL